MVNTSDILPNTPRYLKVPLIFFNLVLWILGLILIIIGGWALKQLKNVNGLNINVTLPAGLVVLGVFIIILTVLGCVVAFKEQLVGLIAYTLVILVLLVCLIGVGGAAFSYRNDADSLLTKAWNKTNGGVIAPIERYFDCCGWSGMGNGSYYNATLHNGQFCRIPTPNVNGTAPDNTTSTTTTTGTSTTTGESTSTTGEADNTTGGGTARRVYFGVRSTYATTTDPGIPNTNTTDCHTKIVNYVNDKMYVAGVAGVVIGVIEFVCMLFSLFLIVRLCRNPRSRSYEG